MFCSRIPPPPPPELLHAVVRWGSLVVSSESSWPAFEVVGEGYVFGKQVGNQRTSVGTEKKGPTEQIPLDGSRQTLL